MNTACDGRLAIHFTEHDVLRADDRHGVGGTQMVSKLSLLAEATQQEIDHWVAKFPPGRQRSASLAALRAALAVDFTEHDVLRADDRDRVGNHVAARHFIERGQVGITRRTDLQTIRLVRAI